MTVLSCFTEEKVCDLLCSLNGIWAVRDVQEGGPLEGILLRMPLGGSDWVLQSAENEHVQVFAGPDSTGHSTVPVLQDIEQQCVPPTANSLPPPLILT